MKICEMSKGDAAVALSVVMLAAASAAHADDRLWREQARANASATIALDVMGGEAETTPAMHVWSEQVTTATVPVVTLAWRGAETAPDYASWREQVAQARRSDAPLRIARRR